MSITYRGYSTKATLQSEPIPGSNQIPNEAGGFGYPVDDWTRLNRFLILGSEGGTYYIKQEELTKQNAQAVQCCIATDGLRTVQAIRELSLSGAAPKNEPALFALAMCAGLGDEKTRHAALNELTSVARTGTHLLHFIQYVTQFRGWGRGLRRAVSKWYTSQNLDHLQYELIKYQSRDKWSQRDVLRLAHPRAGISATAAVLRYATHGVTPAHVKERSPAQATSELFLPHMGSSDPDNTLKLLWAFEQSKNESATDDIIAGLIRDYRLPREAIPTQFLTKEKVWAALLIDMPMTAMIRNLATMTRIGLLTDWNEQTAKVVEQLNDVERLRKARIHPINVLAALRTYAQGHGEKSSNKWTPITKIVDALDRAFYLTFDNVQPTNKRFMLGLDVSGSMRHAMTNGMPFMSCIDAECAMALVTASVEPNYSICAFDTVAKPLIISPRQRLDDVIKATSALVSGGTDCSIPIKVALDRKQPVDVFVIFTDSESWAGSEHPMQALQEYRRKMQIPAKMVVASMAATSSSIGNTGDGGVLELVGIDSNAPSLISQFSMA